MSAPADRRRDDAQAGARALAPQAREPREPAPADDAESDAAALARVTGAIAHDLGNHLTALLSYAELALGQAEPGSKLAGQLARMLQSAERSAALTRELLAFAPSRTGPVGTVDLGELCRATAGLARASAGERTEVVCEAPRELWPVHADRVELQRVFLSFVALAAAQLPAGGVVRVSARNLLFEGEELLPGGDYVEWTIEPDGPELAPAPPALAAQEPGAPAGLGLDPCYGIVRRRGGWIAVRPSGKGRTVAIRLPRAGAERH